eukprot:CAMPEP_0179369426 /NCGR_PEP_ID=MMETSP0797-20121207/84611_1 /TAXON_ID=47934 /ORGANISM="Dinophysis acuminata, Strain DAEP01" /LENGTH=148 /DNA_ID=CAMNT_0021085061 /DNA_START=251 /DNA_END=699 /DNA_ORIENTATION=+
MVLVRDGGTGTRPSNATSLEHWWRLCAALVGMARMGPIAAAAAAAAGVRIATFGVDPHRHIRKPICVAVIWKRRLPPAHGSPAKELAAVVRIGKSKAHACEHSSSDLLGACVYRPPLGVREVLSTLGSLADAFALASAARFTARDMLW